MVVVQLATCSRTLAVSMGMVAVSATQPASPALMNLTATPGGVLPAPTSPLRAVADDIAMHARRYSTLGHTRTRDVHTAYGAARHRATSFSLHYTASCRTY